MDPEIVDALMSRLEERGAPDAIALADLMRIEQQLSDSLRTVRRLIDAIVRRTGREEFGHAG